MHTQWRVGFNGPTGLDYAALPAVFDLMQISADDRAFIFQDLRVLESQALIEIHKKNDA